MLANYGYKDGSGDFFITIDTDKCNGCEKCVPACPPHVLEMIVDDWDNRVAAVTDAQRKKLKYACMVCKPASALRRLLCVEACQPGAITHSW